jgi:VWFA-related protein
MRVEVTRLLRLRAEVEGEQLMKRALAADLSLLISLIPNLFIVECHHAQQLYQGETLRLKAELVEVDVVVTDKNNRPVTDLKREDFLLLEDGEPQQISFFSLVRPNASGNKAPEGHSQQLMAGRFIFIILDQAHISRDSYPRLRESLFRFITEDLSPQDQVAVIGTSGRMAVFQQASKNKRAMALAINAFLGGQLDYGRLAETAPTNPQLDPNIPAIPAPVRENPTEVLFKEYYIRNGLRSLSSIAKNVSQLPGRKIAIFVSENLPVWSKPPEGKLPRDFRDSIDSTDFENFSAELYQVIGLSRRSGLVFYTLDPRGLIGPFTSRVDNPDPQQDLLAKDLYERSGLRALAWATGGFPIFNYNDLRAGLQRVLTDNEAYYLLGYYPTNSTQDGKFRKIKVTIRGRPDLIVRTRQGYIARREEEKKESKQERVKRALASLVPLRNVKVELIKAEQLIGRLLKVMIRLDPSSMKFEEEGDRHTASFEVIGFAYDISGRLVDGFSKTFNLKLKHDTYSLALQGGINVSGQMSLKGPGLYSIRVVVIDRKANQIGTANDWIEAK